MNRKLLDGSVGGWEECGREEAATCEGTAPRKDGLLRNQTEGHAWNILLEVHLGMRLERQAEARWKVLYAMLKSIMEPVEGFIWEWNREGGFGIGWRMV